MGTYQKRKPPERRNSAPLKYRPEHPFRIYQLARDGYSLSRIAEAIGIRLDTLTYWRDNFPEIQAALDTAKTDREAGGTSVKEWVYGRLPDDLKDLWDRIAAVAEEDSGVAAVEAVLSDKGERVRQHLFLHALVEHNFDPSKAGAVVNVGKATLDRWTQDPGFARLVDEVVWHKGNFVEGQLMALVRQGDPAAVIFASKTLNRDRGYDTKVTVEHKGSVDHRVKVDDLNLPLDERVRILEAVRAANRPKALPARTGEVIEGEVVR